MRYAIIENDIVVNVIVADAKFIKDNKLKAIECNDEVCTGWLYQDKEFIRPIVNETLAE